MSLSGFSVLRLLVDGEFHSGVALARTMGVSRASICNVLRSLDTAGLAIFRVRGRGYRLAQPLSLLDSAVLARELGTHAGRFQLTLLDSAVSTNTLLMQPAAAGAASGSVIAAEWQTQGRGRRGRAWHAAPTAALTFSLLWRFEQGAAALAGLSLCAGLAVARVLKAVGADDIGLKWPNDVMWRGAKLAGILIELQGDVLGPSAAVIGIGINVRLPEGLRERIDQPAADLATACGAAPDRNRLLALLLIELENLLAVFACAGFKPLRREWQRWHVHQGKQVRLTLPDGTIVSGRAEGVAEDGSLLVATAGGSRRYHSGELDAAISVVKQN